MREREAADGIDALQSLQRCEAGTLRAARQESVHSSRRPDLSCLAVLPRATGRPQTTSGASRDLDAYARRSAVTPAYMPLPLRRKDVASGKRWSALTKACILR